MNDFNSLLIEGTVINNPTTQEHAGVIDACTFTIVSHRTTSEKTRETTLPVHVYGKLAANCVEYLRTGRQVRIVGTIAGDAESIAVVAEHVEFRPMKRGSALPAQTVVS